MGARIGFAGEVVVLIAAAAAVAAAFSALRWCAAILRCPSRFCSRRARLVFVLDMVLYS